MTKLDYKSLVGSRTETTNNEFNIAFYLSFSQTVARGTTQSSLPMTKLDYKSLVGSRTETTGTEFNIAFLNAPVTARGTASATDFGFKKSIQMVEG